jgi:glycosyltransferase involved in cell wall biosynthesis
MHIPDAAMLEVFDACIGLSCNVEKYFSSRQIPFLWMPGGCSPARALPLDAQANADGPIRFGYFGALAPHAGVEPLVEAVLACEVSVRLEICGYGKMAAHLRKLASQSPRLKYHGLISPAECLLFGRSCDVLVNPRPASHGNENNFASKLFEYALTGRAILTSNLSGVEAVLGPEAYYVRAHDFAFGLRVGLCTLAATARVELNRRGASIQQRILGEFCWKKQGARIAQFLDGICGRHRTGTQPAPEPALEVALMQDAATCPGQDYSLGSRFAMRPTRAGCHP